MANGTLMKLVDLPNGDWVVPAEVSAVEVAYDCHCRDEAVLVVKLVVGGQKIVVWWGGDDEDAARAEAAIWAHRVNALKARYCS